MDGRALASRSFFKESSGVVTALILGRRPNAIKSKRPTSCLNVPEYNHEHNEP